MVYLNTIIKQGREAIIELNNIECAAYLTLRNKDDLTLITLDLSPQEKVALKGYLGEPVREEEVNNILEKRPIKGFDATTNIYKLAGLYLSSKGLVKSLLFDKFDKANLRQKYFLSLIEPDLIQPLKEEVKASNGTVDAPILKRIFFPELPEPFLEESISCLINEDIGVLEILILEDLQQALLRTKYINLSAEELVRNILNEFGNSIQKIVANRRKGHAFFEINDEYDVQDVLYVILKSVFPDLRDEDPIPKVGAKSTKIDLILRKEKILIEVKMIKKSDSNETQFIEELKVDFESYHLCQWLEKLFCFVYDPYKKTKDISNFRDLNGLRKKTNHQYNIEVIVVN